MIYLDNSATTKPHESVLQTFLQVNEHYYANPASIHKAGVEANDLLTRAREQVASILNTEEKQVIFTSGGTESNNFALYGVAKSSTHKGKHIIISEIEHPSVLEAAKRLIKEGFDVEYLRVNEQGKFSIEQLKRIIRKDTILVSVMHVNNEMGAISPIREMAQIIHDNSRAVFHVDAVQSFGKMPVTFDGENGPDILTVSGHKIHGLKGSGIIAFRKQFNVHPFLVGGGQEYGLRSGTVAVPLAVSFAKAARLAVEKIQVMQVQYKKWNRELRGYLAQFGEEIFILSPEDAADHILSFSVRGLKGEILINALQKENVIVSTSSACSSKQTKDSHVVEAMKVAPQYKKGVIRISFGAMTTDQDIETFKARFQQVMNELKGEVTQ
jgi:cysteine desulfurase